MNNEKTTRNYIKHTYQDGLTPEQKRKQRRDARKQLKSQGGTQTTSLPLPTKPTGITAVPTAAEKLKQGLRDALKRREPQTV